MVDQLTQLEDVDRSLFPINFAIRALRDSRYHNTAYAIAELIDNSIEAHAEQIELLCMEKPRTVNSRTRQQVVALAVLDNGGGMARETLLNGLKFGGGTRHNTDRGIGKYGMGLPTSSMSQCKRVDVWTWQEGLESAWHCCIDADKIEQGDHLVPYPDQDTPIPEAWRKAGTDEIYAHRSGTLVVWSELDKIQWKTGQTIIDHTAREIGRIHRHWIDAEMARICAATFRERCPLERDYEIVFVPNDPLYLMNPTSTPEPWNDQPMFTRWIDPVLYTFIVDGREQTIEVKYSIVKPEALKTERVTQNPGNEPHGKHARHNIGVSVVREDREITLEDAFLREGGSAENPQNRWWGCQVLFFRASDELFGLDHNKQMVVKFTQAAKTLARDDRPYDVILNEIGIDADDIIHRIVGDIRDQTRAMMRQIRLMFEQRRSPQPAPNSERPTPELKAARTATDADQDAMDAGEETPTQTDIDREEIPPEEREARLTQYFVELGMFEEVAQQLARLLVHEGLSYQFNSAQLDGSQVFNVRSNHGVLHINLNTDHPIYDLLKQIEGRLHETGGENDPAFLSTVAIRLLLLSWARMEDQTEPMVERTRIQDIAINWGRQAHKFISQLRERDG